MAFFSTNFGKHDMVRIYQRIDQKEDYDFILESFLKREHVTSERQWIELYCQINNVKEEKAYKKLSSELTTYFLLQEMDNDDYLDDLREKLGDTSCICMNREEVFYEPSFALNIANEFLKIMKIDYDTKEGYLFVTGITNTGKQDVAIYVTLTEHADSVAKSFVPMRKSEVLDKDEYDKKQKIMMTIWNDKSQRIPFLEKVNIKLKYA